MRARENKQILISHLYGDYEYYGTRNLKEKMARCKPRAPDLLYEYSNCGEQRPAVNQAAPTLDARLKKLGGDTSDHHGVHYDYLCGFSRAGRDVQGLSMRVIGGLDERACRR
jgi:hypothetical protein